MHRRVTSHFAELLNSPPFILKKVHLVGNLETRTSLHFAQLVNAKSTLSEGSREPEVPSGCGGDYSFIELQPSSKSSTTVAEESVLYDVKHPLPQRYLLHNRQVLKH